MNMKVYLSRWLENRFKLTASAVPFLQCSSVWYISTLADNKENLNITKARGRILICLIKAHTRYQGSKYVWVFFLLLVEYLIDAKGREKRRKTMKKVCFPFHCNGLVDGHFARFKNTIKKTNEMTLADTKILLSAWKKGSAKSLSPTTASSMRPLRKNGWAVALLCQSSRYASTMMGADYGVFANGRWHMSKNIQGMVDWSELKLEEKK